MIQRTGNNVLGVVGCLLAMAACVPVSGLAAAADAGYYNEEHVYLSRPSPEREMHLGSIGVTGLKVRVYKGVVIKVEEITPHAPADGKFKVGQIISGINGEALKGKNPFVACGSALTQAEATDGYSLQCLQA